MVKEGVPPLRSTGHLLEVVGLEIEFLTSRGTVRAVRGVDLTMNPGETVGLVGESGSGKSVTADAIIGLTELPGRVTAGQIFWKGEQLVGAATEVLRRIRGKEMAIIFQDPMTSLNPLLTVGTQIIEVLRRHLKMEKSEATRRAVELLELVGIASPRIRFHQYPHELSGGMRQRAMIAIALACEPQLLIADEPTTALDVTIQAQILDLLARLQEELRLAVLLITHDLGVVAALCERVEVMYAGRIVEAGTAAEIFKSPGHPYANGLLHSIPRPDAGQHRLIGIPGAPPDPRNLPSGCTFHPRCPLAFVKCSEDAPALIGLPQGRRVACWRAFEAVSWEPTHAQELSHG